MSSVDYYNKNAEQYFRETFAVDLTEIYPPFLKRLPENAHILDAGCGSGRDSLYFLNQGYRLTAIDASNELARLASTAIGQEVLPLAFEQITYKNEFDGVWACASLLHIPRGALPNVLNILANALKSEGILFASFKEGDGEYQIKDRYFNCYGEDSIDSLLESNRRFHLIRKWVSADSRPERSSENWLNILLTKVD